MCAQPEECQLIPPALHSVAFWGTEEGFTKVREWIPTTFKATNSSSKHFCLESLEAFTKLTSSIYQNSSPVTRLLCTDITQLFPACNLYTQKHSLWREKEYLKYCILPGKQKGERADRRLLGEGCWKK